MEQIYNQKMSQLGYSQLVCDIFLNWEDVKDEILLPERKEGSGNGTIHVFLGAADSVFKQEFADYYQRVNSGEDPAVGAIKVKHYFMPTNAVSMLGYVCQYNFKRQKLDTSDLSRLLSSLQSATKENELLTTYSFLKLSTGSNKLRPYFKQFESNGVFQNIIRHLLLPQSAYKISLYKNPKGEYAAFWLIGFKEFTDFEADSSKLNLVPVPNFNGKYQLQQIYYGAPGTGKSNKTNAVTAKYPGTIRTTFHPDSDYSTFVGAYKPTTTTIKSYGLDSVGKTVAIMDLERNVVNEETKIEYKFVKQAFLKAYIQAWKLYQQTAVEEREVAPQFLVIEEINRGNCAQIFGDLFQLLDRKNGFSEYPIEADEDIRKCLLQKDTEEDPNFGENGLALSDEQKAYIDSIFDPKDGTKRHVADKICKGEVLVLPPNLYIWATMNTSDQSLFPIDSAFKRRWDWKYMRITNHTEMAWRIKFDYLDNGEVQHEDKDWWEFLYSINKHIKHATHSEDKQLGYFFCKANDDKAITAETFVGKVVFYLWNDVFKTSGYKKTVFKDMDFDKFYLDNAESTEDNPDGLNKLLVHQFIENVIETAKEL